MKYELILKVKEWHNQPYEEKYRIVVEEENFERAFKNYEERSKYLKDKRLESILLINKLDDNGEFIEVVQ